VCKETQASRTKSTCRTHANPMGSPGLAHGALEGSPPLLLPLRLLRQSLITYLRDTVSNSCLLHLHNVLIALLTEDNNLNGNAFRAILLVLHLTRRAPEHFLSRSDRTLDVGSAFVQVVGPLGHNRSRYFDSLILKLPDNSDMVQAYKIMRLASLPKSDDTAGAAKGKAEIADLRTY
jgi:hypothetical protein